MQDLVSCPGDLYRLMLCVVTALARAKKGHTVE